jgi:hypothetical protein
VDSKKPHPNGLKNFIFTTKISNPNNNTKTRPHILNILHHLIDGYSGNHDIVLKFLQHFLFVTKPYIVLDAVFSSIELLKKIHQWGGILVISVVNNVYTDVWQVLLHNTPTETWRIAKNNNDVIISSHIIINNNKRSYQHL